MRLSGSVFDANQQPVVPQAVIRSLTLPLCYSHTGSLRTQGWSLATRSNTETAAAQVLLTALQGTHDAESGDQGTNVLDARQTAQRGFYCRRIQQEALLGCATACCSTVRPQVDTVSIHAGRVRLGVRCRTWSAVGCFDQWLMQPASLVSKGSGLFVFRPRKVSGLRGLRGGSEGNRLQVIPRPAERRRIPFSPPVFIRPPIRRPLHLYCSVV
jgi:hypothetical protein